MTMEIDWQRFITVEDGWVAKLLNMHPIQKNDKLMLRTYTVKFTGIKYDTAEFIEYIKTSIKNYVLNQQYLNSITEKNGDPFEEALIYFGEGSNPTNDGKYGELILYLLTEAILKIPMIVLKIPTGDNMQQHGADGIFCGNYEGLPAILFGESKTVADLNTAINSAFQSLHRFHDPTKIATVKYELFVAKSMVNTRLDLTKEELDYLYDCLTISGESYENRVKVHPVLIIYDNNRIANITEQDQSTSELKLAKIIENTLQDNMKCLKDKLSQYSDMGTAYLDFFFIPLEDVNKFRHDLYKALHGKCWQDRK